MNPVLSRRIGRWLLCGLCAAAIVYGVVVVTTTDSHDGLLIGDTPDDLDHRAAYLAIVEGDWLWTRDKNLATMLVMDERSSYLAVYQEGRIEAHCLGRPDFDLDGVLTFCTNPGRQAAATCTGVVNDALTGLTIEVKTANGTQVGPGAMVRLEGLASDERLAAMREAIEKCMAQTKD